MTTASSRPGADPKLATSPAALVIAIVATTFAVEIVIMELYPRWDRGLSAMQGAGADAAMLCLVMIPVLYVAVYRPLRATIGHLERALEDLRLAAEVVEKTSEGIVIADSNARILRVNRSFSSITGYSAEEAVGKSTSLLKSGLQDRAFYEDMWASILGNGEWSGEIWNRRKDGQVYLESLSITMIKHGPEKDVHFVGIFSQARHDGLTGLANRHVMMDELAAAVRRAANANEPIAVLFIDLDGFKAVNDRFGHDLGDRLLQAVGRALKRALRPGDVAARIGGDEFVVLLPALRGVEDAERVASEVRKAIKDAAGRTPEWKDVSASIGVAIAEGPELAEPAALLRSADQAMLAAKRQGKDRIVARRHVPAPSAARDP